MPVTARIPGPEGRGSTDSPGIPVRASDVISGRARFAVGTGECLGWLRSLPSECVHTAVTSPPYYALRDYQTATWIGGDPGCDHRQGRQTGRVTPESKNGAEHANVTRWNTCGKCGSVREDHQIGLEESPDAFIAKLVAVFREVKRVLRDDGTLWVVIGDSYCSTDKWGGGGGNTGKQTVAAGGVVPSWESTRKRKSPINGMKPKDLLGVPWMLAFALRADGWYLRQECIWSKPNVMPSSARDRCTTAHESVFLLSKSPRYYFDQQAIDEPVSGTAHARGKGVNPKSAAGNRDSNRQNPSFSAAVAGLVERRNKRSVWRIPTRGYPGAHFATFPPDLVRPCVLAGSSEKGCCPACGAPWRRVTRKDRRPTRPGTDTKVTGVAIVDGNRDPQRHVTTTETVGWEPTCGCGAEVRPCVVLDPFGGSGTTIAVANQEGRHGLTCDLNPEYVALIHERMAGVVFGSGAPPRKPKRANRRPSPSQPSLFAGADA